MAAKFERAAESAAPGTGRHISASDTYVRVALQLLLNLKRQPLMPRRMSVWPVAIHTRTPLGIGIIAETAR